MQGGFPFLVSAPILCAVIACSELKTVMGIAPGSTPVVCRLDDGSTLELPSFLGRFIRQGDAICVLPNNTGLLVERTTSRSRCQLLLQAIGYVADPKPSGSGA